MNSTDYKTINQATETGVQPSNKSSCNIDLSDLTPFVRYGKPTTDGVQQFPQLHAWYEPIPEDAKIVSPIYLLTPDQTNRYDQLKQTPFATSGTSNIAFELQEACEQHNQVLYPIVIESDAMDDNVQPTEMKKWLIQFITNELPISPTHCSWYHSGNRSIHSHIPLFAHGEQDRETLKQKVTQFNNKENTELDTGIYNPKHPFRIPGVPHEITGDHKIPIEVDDGRPEIVQAIVNKNPQKPETYGELIESIFGPPILSGSTIKKPCIWTPNTPEKKEIPVPLVERKNSPSDRSVRQKWKQYNRHEFSPYALAKPENPRSLFIGQVKGGAYCRRDERKERIYLPCFIWVAIGCDTNYRIHMEYGPLYLSKPDYDKLNVEIGDHIVVIGGRNRRSRIFKVDEIVAKALHGTIYDKNTPKELNIKNKRDEVLQMLTDLGYDVGESGMHGEYRSTHSQPQKDKASNSSTQELRQQIEASSIDDIPDPEYPAVFRVCCGILKGEGWDEAWTWLQKEFGKVDRFDPELAYAKLKKIVEWKPDEYAHVRIPEPPST